MSDLLEQLESYGDQLEETVPRYEFDPRANGRDRQVPWAAILGIAASVLLVFGVFIWAQGRGDDSQSLEVIDQPALPIEPDTADSAPTEVEPNDDPEPVGTPESAEAVTAAPTAEPVAVDDCQGLSPGLLPLQKQRPAMRVVVAEIESAVGDLPVELEPGSYSTTALGIELTFDAGECVTLVEENPGMLTFVPAGESLSDSSPWMSVLVPAAVSSTGAASFTDAEPVGADIGEWAAMVDGVEATSLGSVQVGGVTGTEWELGVNSESLEPFFCSRGQCASVVRPQVAWWGTFRRPTLSHLPGFIHVDSTNTTRVIELDVPGTRLWVWRQAPSTDDEFFDKSTRWLDGWTFGDAAPGPDHNGSFGPVGIGPLTVAPGATMNIFEDGWAVLSNSKIRAVLVPPVSVNVETPTHVIEVLRATNDEFEALTAQETVDGFADLDGLSGWSVDSAAPGQLGDFASTVIDLNSFGSSNGVGFSLWTMPTGRVHIIAAEESAWIVMIGGPDVDAVNALEQAATQLLIGADLPDWLVNTS